MPWRQRSLRRHGRPGRYAHAQRALSNHRAKWLDAVGATNSGSRQATLAPAGWLSAGVTCRSDGQGAGKPAPRPRWTQYTRHPARRDPSTHLRRSDGSRTRAPKTRMAFRPPPGAMDIQPDRTRHASPSGDAQFSPSITQATSNQKQARQQPFRSPQPTLPSTCSTAPCRSNNPGRRSSRICCSTLPGPHAPSFAHPT